jgi:iron(III) transport system ATP-binding protein
MSEITLRQVCKHLGATPVLTGVDLVVPHGSTTAVLGPSGSGKTTLLRLIAGFERVDTGRISIADNLVDDGVNGVSAQHRRVGYVPQEGALFPHLTVRANIGFGLGRRDRAGTTEQLLELVGLRGLGKRMPHQLSGGQQQRVALARALAVRPSVVLLDEPFSSLDASLRAEVRRDVARVLAEAEATTILVTHDQQEALGLADQIALLREGRVVACADPHTLYRRPPDLGAATFIGEANIMPATLRGITARCALGDIPVTRSSPTYGPATLLIRPEQLQLHTTPTPTAAPATVLHHHFHGHDALVTVALTSDASTTLLARAPGDLPLSRDQPVWIQLHGPAHPLPS